MIEMSAQSTFSFDWVAAVEAGGTWAIAILAIWGEWLRGLIFKPAPNLELLSPVGEFVVQTVGQ